MLVRKLSPSVVEVRFLGLSNQQGSLPELTLLIFSYVFCGLTKKAEPPPTRDVNRDSGTASANGGWLRRLVRHHGHVSIGLNRIWIPLPWRCRCSRRHLIIVVGISASPIWIGNLRADTTSQCEAYYDKQQNNKCQPGKNCCIHASDICSVHSVMMPNEKS